MLKDYVWTSIFVFNCYLCLGTLHGVRVQTESWMITWGNQASSGPMRLNCEMDSGIQVWTVDDTEKVG